MSFKMLCIDASTREFGLAYFTDGKLHHVKNISVDGIYGRNLDKAHEIYKQFDGIFLQSTIYQKLAVDHVVFEEPVPIHNSKAVTSINQIIGVLIGMCFERNLTVDWVHNRTVKSLMGINKKGKEGKQQSKDIAKSRYPEFATEIITDHISDAILVGETYKLIMKENSNE